jgi:hypothetical protein
MARVLDEVEDHIAQDEGQEQWVDPAPVPMGV